MRLLFLLLLFAVHTAAAALIPNQLRCEYRENPLGIDAAQPRLSWILASGRRGERQTAYQIQVTTAKGETLWETGKVMSDETTQIVYQGKALDSQMSCVWKVRVWNEKDLPSEWSKPAQWSMGLLQASDWRGKWIGLEKGEVKDLLTFGQWIWFPEGESAKKAPPVGNRYFRRTLDLPSRQVRGAFCRIAADESFTLFVNGQEAGKGGRNTAVSIEITRLLQAGRNQLAIAARGSNQSAGLVGSFKVEFLEGDPLFLAIDGQWRVSKEKLDGWDRLDFDDTAWPAAMVLGKFGMDPWGHLNEVPAALAGRMLRREFKVDQPISRATVYLSGLGLSELYLNGQKISGDVLSPGLTNYDRRALYVTYDVTKGIRSGNNAIGVMLGNGRFFGPRNEPPYGYPKLMFQLVLEHPDGSKEVVASDERWKITDQGPIVANNEFDGETYDARREPDGWARPGFDDRSWQTVDITGGIHGILAAQMAEPIRVIEDIKPLAVTEPKPGVFVFDMGQNMVGWCRLKVSGASGSAVQLRFAERLNEDGTLYLANLRSARVTDLYTLKGQGEEVWEPRFVYHGFRYVELTGWPEEKPPALPAIVGRVVHDNLPNAGEFSCSNELLNQIHHNIFWGTRGNYRSMPTDCPQRDERQGWLGDRSAESLGETYLFDTSTLYAKWLQDIADTQDSAGIISDVAPNFWKVYSDGVVWSSAFLIIPHGLYRQYGDERNFQKQYEAMKFWMEHAIKYRVKDGLIAQNAYGDWCVPPESPTLVHSVDPKRKTEGSLLSTVFFYYDLTLMDKVARLLGKTEDAARFAELAGAIKEAFNKQFLNREGGFYSNGTQTSSVLPLAFGLVPEELKPQVFAHLVKQIEQGSDGHIGTGLVGGQFLLRVLSDNGRADLACRLATQKTYPSWGYMVSQGATTMWELWNGNTANPAMNSGNHVMLIGDLNIWLMEYLAGIRPDAPGFKKIIIQPYVAGDLTWVKARYDSIRGRISCHWERKDKNLSLSVSIPPNTQAAVYVPAASRNAVNAGAGGGVKFLRMEKGAAVFEIESGQYNFTSTLAL